MIEVTLKEYLKHLEITQSHVARKIKKSKETISRLVKGNLKVTEATKESLVNYLDYYRQMEIQRLSDKIKFLQSLILK